MNELLELSKKTADFNIRNFLEVLALLDGSKKVMRLSLHDNSEPIIRMHIERLGLNWVRSKFRQKTSFTSNLGDSYTESVSFSSSGDLPFTVMVSFDQNAACSALEMEEETGDFDSLGIMLGYPSCCVKSYGKIKDGNDWLKVALSNTPISNAYEPAVNKLSYLFSGMTLFYDYFPCSFNCIETATISTKIGALLKNAGFCNLYETVYMEMTYPIILLDGMLIQLRNAVYDKFDSSLKYDLSLSRQWIWVLCSGIEDNVFWGSDFLRFSNEWLEFYCGKKFLGRVFQGEFQRLLLFRSMKNNCL